MVFHPRFPEKREVYISYTGFDKNQNGGRPSQSNLFVRLSRFQVRGDYTIDTASEEILFSIKKDRGNHNGGGLAFERQNGQLTSRLFFGTGDGGIPRDPNGRGVDPGVLLAKVLRVDVDGRENGKQYGIPDDNPFRGDNRFKPEIYTWGHRNPCRIAVSPANGDVYEAEVGQEAFEEVNLLKKGQNYGWSFKEGPSVLLGDRKQKIESFLHQGEKITDPIASYGRDEGRSVTGGVVYRGNDPKLAAFKGRYVFGDFVTGNLWVLIPDNGKFKRQLVGTTGVAIGTFGEDNDGNMYILDHFRGTIFRLADGPAVEAQGDVPLNFFLTRDGTGTEKTATEYYESTCAIQDASNQQRCQGEPATPTFDAWAKAYLKGDTQKALYQNVGDLGFWRDMVCNKSFKPGEGGCSVTNWKDPDAKGRFDGATPQQILANKDLWDLGTVTMNVSKEGYTRFYVFVPTVKDGKFTRVLSKAAVLDFEGPKFVPNLCTPCHAGNYGGDPDLGSVFREFDPAILKRHPSDTDEKAQKKWFDMNKSARSANQVLFGGKLSQGRNPATDDNMAAMLKAVDWLDYLYDVPKSQRNEDLSLKSEPAFKFARNVSDDKAVPASWKTGNSGNAALADTKVAMWKNFVGPYCMQCHRLNSVDFSSYANFEPLAAVTGDKADLEGYVGFKGEELGIDPNLPLEEFNKKKNAVKLGPGRLGKDFMPNAKVTRDLLLSDREALTSMQEWLTQAAGGNDPVIDVTFEVHTRQITQACQGDVCQDLYVIGSLKQLGAVTDQTKNGLPRPANEKWDVTSGIKLTGKFVGQDHLVWTGKARLPLHAEVRFKSYVLLNVAEQVRWQCDDDAQMRATFNPGDGARGRDKLRIDGQDYAVKIRADLNPANFKASDAKLRIVIGEGGQDRPHYENKFHANGTGDAGGCGN